MKKEIIANFKNWKWWAVLPLMLPWLFVALVPKVLIYIIEKILLALEFLNFGERHCKTLERITNWVNK